MKFIEIHWILRVLHRYLFAALLPFSGRISSNVRTHWKRLQYSLQLSERTKKYVLVNPIYNYLHLTVERKNNLDNNIEWKVGCEESWRDCVPASRKYDRMAVPNIPWTYVKWCSRYFFLRLSFILHKNTAQFLSLVAHNFVWRAFSKYSIFLFVWSGGCTLFLNDVVI